MTRKERAELRLSCFYAAMRIMDADRSALALTKGGKEPRRTRPTTEEVLAEAKKISQWVLPMEGDEK